MTFTPEERAVASAPERRPMRLRVGLPPDFAWSATAADSQRHYATLTSHDTMRASPTNTASSAAGDDSARATPPGAASTKADARRRFGSRGTAVRGLVWTLVRTDFKARYHGTLGGFVWALLKPLAMFVVLMAVFSFVFAANPHYRLESDRRPVPVGFLRRRHQDGPDVAARARDSC